jgi:hypothetical protein
VTDPGESYLPWDRWPLLKMTLRDGADGQGLNRPPTAYEAVDLLVASGSISLAPTPIKISLRGSYCHPLVRSLPFLLENARKGAASAYVGCASGRESHANLR